MGRLTDKERRRVFQAQEHARRTMLEHLASEPIPSEEPRVPRAGLRRLLATAVIVGLLGGGWLLYRVVEFHPPESIIEALLPRR
jgi:hypothetical protein